MATDNSPPEDCEQCPRLGEHKSRESFARAAAYDGLSPIKRWLRSPARTTIIKAANVIGRRARVSMPLRTRTFWGVSMRVRIPEAVSNQLFRCGLFEAGVTAYMLRILKPGDTVLDVGAHYGYFTLLASDLVGITGEVHAFEPTPSTFGVLIRNIRDRRNIVANNTAVWADRQEIVVTDLGARLSAFNSIFRPRLNGKELRRVKVRQVPTVAVSLDDYCSERALRPTFVKVDAESSEHQIVRGMKWLLSSVRPFVSLEVGDFDLPDVPGSAKLVETMASYDYTPLEYANGDVRIHRLCESYQYDNLLFAPSENSLVQLIRGD